MKGILFFSASKGFSRHFHKKREGEPKMTAPLFWRRMPTMEDGRPGWFHKNGMTVRVDGDGRHPNFLILRSDAMRMDIMRSPNASDNHFVVEWVIVRPAGKMRGRIIMTPAELVAAFGLSNDPGVGGEEFVMGYGGDSSVPGKYHRWNLFLNVPCPGTGCDGDPNNSIYLTEAIKSAVSVLSGGLM